MAKDGYTDQQAQLVLNILNKSKYNELSERSWLNANELYLVPDDVSDLNVNVEKCQVYCRVSIIMVPSTTTDTELVSKFLALTPAAFTDPNGKSSYFLKGGSGFGTANTAPSDSNKTDNDCFVLQGRQIILRYNDAKGFRIFTYTGGVSSASEIFGSHSASNPPPIALRTDETECSFTIGTDIVVFIKVET